MQHPGVGRHMGRAAAGVRPDAVLRPARPGSAARPAAPPPQRRRLQCAAGLCRLIPSRAAGSGRATAVSGHSIQAATVPSLFLDSDGPESVSR